MCLKDVSFGTGVGHLALLAPFLSPFEGVNMKDLKPNVHCHGCGAPSFSAPKETGANPQSDRHYCRDCEQYIARGVRSAKMLDHIWFSKFPIALKQLQGKRKLTHSDLDKLSLLRCDRNCSCLPAESPFEGDPHKMTSEEWKEVGMMRLAHHKQTCGCERRTAALLRSLVRGARV